MLYCDIYVQVFESHVQARNLKTHASSRIEPAQPYSHPRSLIGSFTNASVAVKAAVNEVKGFATLKLLRIVIHPMARTEGGLTEVEERVLRELALGAGASNTVVWVGTPLSDEAATQKLQKT